MQLLKINFNSNNNNAENINSPNPNPIPRRPYNHGDKLGSGQQGTVYKHKNNNNKVVKLRTFKKIFTYKKNNEMNRALNNYYSEKLQNLKSKVKINKNTSILMNKYPHYFLEAFLQYKAGEANLSAKVHEIFATEENNRNAEHRVHIYIVMDKLSPVNSTSELRKELAKKLVPHDIAYQNGDTWGAAPKPNHVMAKKNGRILLINFGNSRFLTPAEIIEHVPKLQQTNIRAIGPKSLTIRKK